MKQKLLTIAIPTYNGSRTISKTLEVFLPQCDDRVEVIVCDNASTDNTIAIVERWQSMYPFIKLVKSEHNVGPDSNFLRCMKLATGKYTLLLSDDDVLIESALPVLLDFLSCNDDMGLVYLNALGFYETYLNAEACEKYQRALYEGESFVTSDKKEFMRYAGRMWGFISCFVCLTEALDSIECLDAFKGTNWLQSYIHVLCASFGSKLLGVVVQPIIGAGIYNVVSNFDSAQVDGVNYREMLDFAIVHGFDKKQLDKIFIWRICFISKRAIVKEKASGAVKTNIRKLIAVTKSYPSAWIKLYPFLVAPKWLCRIAVNLNARRKYRDGLHVNRIGDIAG